MAMLTSPIITYKGLLNVVRGLFNGLFLLVYIAKIHAEYKVILAQINPGIGFFAFYTCLRVDYHFPPPNNIRPQLFGCWYILDYPFQRQRLL